MARQVKTPTVRGFAKSIVCDEVVSHHYQTARSQWFDKFEHDDTGWPYRLIDNEAAVYSHRVFVGYSLARRSLALISKDLWRSDDDPRAYFVGEHSLLTGETKEYQVLRSSVDAARQLWVQILDPDYPASRISAQQAPAYNQRRVEASLNEDYRTDDIRMNLGLGRSYEFVGLAGLEAAIKQVRQDRQVAETRHTYLPLAA